MFQIPRRLVLVLITALGIVSGGVAMTISVVTHVYSHGPPYAEAALLWSLPDPRTGTDPSLGELQFTADKLNRMHQGAEWGPIAFVPPSTPSSRPDMVSVNPIDQLTWGAAAYSVRTNRCYLILVAHDVTNPENGHTLYGRLAPGQACVGLAATRQTVISATEPPE